MNLTIAISLAVIVCQGLNVFLFLRIRVSQLESEKRVLDEVARDFQSGPMCIVRMEEHERRLAKLEARRA